jgi:hypothetical protein
MATKHEISFGVIEELDIPTIFLRNPIVLKRNINFL